ISNKMKTTLPACWWQFVWPQQRLRKTYTNKFDNVDVDGVLGNNRILTNYIKCLMEKGPCTPEGRELKKLLPDALQSDCSKCTNVQKKNSKGY
ncbi:Ejaculatory bulb-specific protein 3, partial [Eumeta japonica]